MGGHLKTAGPVPVSGADLGNYWADYSRIAHVMISKVPSFWTLTVKSTQHFDLIYNIGKSDSNILRNIMKTAQDSYTITIKQIVRLKERMHLEKFRLKNI